MASSTTAGDRSTRWGSSRRGGMTVLGKVAVPKPINLPSQRLENHGLDPNVEIVPKGTLSWGSRPSSSGSNAWASSVLSPRDESGGGSSLHLNGRPSSGGGSRPSTASSEKTQESSSNIWTSNSRPSSASGALASSNVLLTTLRPRSAESRPGSSQLSRFAEPISEGSGAWAANNITDKLQFGAPAGNNFSLSSGDFPTLSSEKSSGKNVEVLEHNSHVRPGSSSGRPHSTAGKINTTSSDVTPESIDAKGGMENMQTKDSSQHIDDGSCSSVDTWQGDHYPYPNTNVPLHPHSYEVWRGPPVNPPSGVWYRPPPGAPHSPYGGPLHPPPPGGYPMEPFSYYRPQVSGPGITNSQSAPSRAAGPRGSPSSNGEMCRPMMEPYMHPAMPMRPGFYPGYYGPPMGYCGPNERDFPYAGMPRGPSPAYNRYASQNRADLSDSHSGKGEVQGPMEFGPANDSRRHHGAPVKQNVGCEKNDQELHAGGRVMPNAYIRDKAHSTRMPIRENEQPRDDGKEETLNHGSQPHPCEDAGMLYSRKGNPPVMFQGNRSDVATAHPVVDSVTGTRDQSLIKKIEGLNAKARASEAKHDRYDKMQTVNVMPSHSMSGASGMVQLERHHPSGVLVPVSVDMNASAKGKSVDASVSTVTTMSRTSGRVVQGRGDFHGKGRLNSQETEGWKKRGAVLEAPNVSQSANPEVTVKEQDIRRSDGEVKDDGPLSIHDPCDNQRAKMREIAKQRATQLQKEEEERIREQKAKALAKLEELNRRSGNLNKEANSQKLETVIPPVSDQAKVVKTEVPAELNAASNQSECTSPTLVFGSIVPLDMRSSEPSSSASGFMCSDPLKISHDPVSLHSRTSPATNDSSINDDTGHQTVLPLRVQKKVGYKLKERSMLPEKDLADQLVVKFPKDNKSTVPSDASKEVMLENVASVSTYLNPSVETGTVVDSSVHARKRGNKGAKNKHKVDGKVPREPDLSKSSTDTTKPNPFILELEPDAGVIATSLDMNGKSYSENTSSGLHDGANSKVGFSKFQHQRKVLRNSLSKPADKSQSSDPAVWAPVKSLNDAETARVNYQKASESATPLARNDNLLMRTIPKTKRAEMERYVPKPVAKELAQQAIVQLPSPAPVEQSDAQLSSSATLEQSIPNSASSGNAGLQPSERSGKLVEPSHWEAGGKARHAKARGSWRQRGSVEPTPHLSSEDRSSSSVYASKDSSNTRSYQAHEESSRGSELFGQGKIPKPDEQLMKGQQCESNENQTVDDGWGDGWGDGWNIVEEPVVSSVTNTFTGPKGHSGSGRGKKHPLKGHVGGQRQNFDQKNPKFSDLNTLVAPLPDSSLSDNRPTSSKGNRVAHWQRKSEVHLGHEQLGNRNRSHWSQDSCADSTASHQGLSKPGVKESSGTLNKSHQEYKRTTKNVPVRGRPYSPNEEPLLEVDSGAYADANSNDQRSSTFGKFPKNGNHNNDRFNRGHDYQGDQSFVAEDGRQNYVAGNRDRQRRNNNSHYEYQPVRGQNNMSNSEGQSGNRNVTQKFRERRPVGNHSRNGGGSFQARQIGSNNVQSDFNYE